MSDAERRAALEAIAAEVAVCTACRLHQGRNRSVPGEGTAATEVLFVGEGPGFNEDKLGRPFVGQAGALLDELLASVGWSRDEVFITNVVKCRPPGNRDPEPDEIAACGPFLARQIATLDPALVVTLGRFSMARFRPGARISQAHGTYAEADESSGAPDALTYSMYHPAAALHQGSLKETLFRDMAGVPAALTESRARRAARPQAEPPAGSRAVAAGKEPGPSATRPEMVELDAEAPESSADGTTPGDGRAPEPAPVDEAEIAPAAAGPVLARAESIAAAAPPPESVAAAEPSASPAAAESKDSNPADQLSLF